MLHDVFILFEGYERLTNGDAVVPVPVEVVDVARRVPRVLGPMMFRIADLESGSRRVLVGLFGEDWVHQSWGDILRVV
jgi:hypothetical protein